MPIVKRRDATDKDMLYELYSLDFLKYLMDMLYEFKSRLDIVLPETDPIRDKKVLIYRYEIVARFCQFAESLGGLINGYDKLNLNSSRQLDKSHVTKVLELLSNYTISNIDEVYKKLQTDSAKYDILFGYDVLSSKNANEVAKSLTNIKYILNELWGCYSFYKESYNAYKHGYRLWFGKDSKNIEAVIYRNKRGKEVHVPIDDNSLEIVMKSGKYCSNTFDLIKSNHKAVINLLQNPHTKMIRMKFLLGKNGCPTELNCTV